MKITRYDFLSGSRGNLEKHEHGDWVPFTEARDLANKFVAENKQRALLERRLGRSNRLVGDLTRSWNTLKAESGYRVTTDSQMHQDDTVKDLMLRIEGRKHSGQPTKPQKLEEVIRASADAGCQVSQTYLDGIDNPA